MGGEECREEGMKNFEGVDRFGRKVGLRGEEEWGSSLVLGRVGCSGQSCFQGSGGRAGWKGLVSLSSDFSWGSLCIPRLKLPRSLVSGRLGKGYQGAPLIKCWE